MKTGSWHCHHDELCEWDIERREVRIAYIKKVKPASELELRIKLYQPMSQEAVAIYEEFCATIAPAKRAYDIARATAQEAYDAARAPAQEAYDVACTTAQEAYEAATTAQEAYEAATTAQEAYEAARATAQEAYNAACATAQEAYDITYTPTLKALVAIHAIECPDCPWDGKSIFPQKKATV